MVDKGTVPTVHRPRRRVPSQRLVAPLWQVPCAIALLLYACWQYLIYAPHVWEVMAWNDFGRFWYALQGWYVDGQLYTPTVATWVQFEDRGAHFWNLNPPHVHLLLLPLSRLSPWTAFAIWMAAQILAGWASWRLIRRIVDLRLSPWLWALVLVSEPALSWVTTGQLSGFMMWFGTAIWASRRQQDDRLVGFWIGLACSTKPFLGVFFVDLLLRRQWRAARWAIASSLALCGAGSAVFGWTSYVEWLGVLRDVQWAGAVMNASAAAIAVRTFGVHALVTDPTALTIGAIVGVIVLVIGLVAAHRADPDQATLILAATSLLASPLGWIYYVWLGVGPFVATWQQSLRLRRVSVSLLGWLVPHFMLWPLNSGVFAFTLGSVYSWTLVAIWCASLRSDRHLASARGAVAGQSHDGPISVTTVSPFSDAQPR